MRASGQFWKLLEERNPSLVPTNRRLHPPASSPHFGDWSLATKGLGTPVEDEELEAARIQAIRSRNWMLAVMLGGALAVFLLVVIIGANAP